MFTDFLTEKIRKGSLVNANTLPLYLDPQFKRVVNKATAVDYTKRYQSCAEFLAAIHDLQRKYPNYRQDGNQLTITHDDLREYMITEVSRNNFQLKKKLPGGDWRLQHGQTGYNNILLIARNKR